MQFAASPVIKMVRLVRSIEAGKAFAAVECPTGHITVLADEDGTAIKSFIASLLGKAPDGYRAEFGDSALGEENVLRVGFSLVLPEITVTQYLVEHGMPEAEVPQILREFDLGSVCTRPCGHLQLTQARQVLLIAALWSAAPVVVLDDPFQPFSGRWRELFAEKLLENVRRTGRVFICVNLGFLPKCWNAKPQVSTTDVSHVVNEAYEKLRKSDESREAEQRAAAKLAQAQNPERNDAYYKPAIPINLPAGVVWAYKEFSDHIFTPLARLSRTLSTLSGALAVGGGAIFMMLAVLIMFPNLSRAQSMLGEMSSHFHVTRDLMEWVHQKVSKDSPEENAEVDEGASVEDGTASVTAVPSAATIRAARFETMKQICRAEPATWDKVEHPSAFPLFKSAESRLRRCMLITKWRQERRITAAFEAAQRAAETPGISG